jgi:hypothetical protein
MEHDLRHLRYLSLIFLSGLFFCASISSASTLIAGERVTKTEVLNLQKSMSRYSEFLQTTYSRAREVYSRADEIDAEFLALLRQSASDATGSPQSGSLIFVSDQVTSQVSWTAHWKINTVTFHETAFDFVYTFESDLVSLNDLDTYTATIRITDLFGTTVTANLRSSNSSDKLHLSDQVDREKQLLSGESTSTTPLQISTTANLFNLTLQELCEILATQPSSWSDAQLQQLSELSDSVAELRIPKLTSLILTAVYNIKYAATGQSLTTFCERVLASEDFRKRILKDFENIR